MPGHKLGAGIPVEFLKEIEKLDLTEITGTDNLHKPTGVLREAQELAASAFGARRCFFLVNGSTVGLHAAIAAMCRPGQRLIVGRDCHRAVINGMLLAGVTPVYMLPEYSESFCLNTGITAEAVRKALETAPDAAGVLITRPNYYGICSDIGEIATVVHAYGKPLVVDEAHGAHLVFNSRLPASALEAGADICIQSAHKTLPAFTQGAYLHIGSDRIDEERLWYFLDMLQTTSPSYVIMTYLDMAREIMQKNGEALLNGLLDSIEASSSQMAASGMRLLGIGDVPGFELDATRITVNMAGLGITGYYTENLLRDKYNIQVEMSDLNNIVCISTVADDAARIARLFDSLHGLGKVGKCGVHPPEPEFRGLTLPDNVAEPSKILNAGTVKVALENAAGRISREIISPYPPGMALVCPGETFTAQMVDYLLHVRQCGGVVHGIEENGNVVVV
jgi:arginine/lysine/ornithine decarboxylase